MKTVYVIEECLGPGIWVLLNNIFYNSKQEASDSLVQISKDILKYKKSFNGRVTELKAL